MPSAYLIPQIESWRSLRWSGRRWRRRSESAGHRSWRGWTSCSGTAYSDPPAASSSTGATMTSTALWATAFLPQQSQLYMLVHAHPNSLGGLHLNSIPTLASSCTTELQSRLQCLTSHAIKLVARRNFLNDHCCS